MTDRLKNPPAFPIPSSEVRHRDGNLAQYGMTLRDYFAGQALTSMLSAPDKITESTYGVAANLSYKFADAMLKERAKS